LRRREGKENHDHGDPAKTQPPHTTGAITVVEACTEDAGQVQDKWKQPQDIEEPEEWQWDCVVIVRIPPIQESKQVLVEEVKPKKAMVLPGPANH
jgi:hypothetical protein